MNENLTNKDITESGSGNSLNLQDLWAMFVPKWYWFILSVIVVVGIATYKVMKMPPVYTRTASILIKDNTKSASTSVDLSEEFQTLGNFRVKTNVYNEVLTLQSPALMQKVAERLNLNITYSTKVRLRMAELYKETPFEVRFQNDSIEHLCNFDITVKSNNHFVLSNFINKYGESSRAIKVGLLQTVKTPVGVLTLVPTEIDAKPFIGKIIYYSQGSKAHLGDAYRVSAALGDKDASIINISITNPSPKKAEDILNTLIEVYNESWIADNNRVAVSTSQFIGERLGVIEGELGNVDQDISSYKSKNLLPDVQAASNLYLTQSAKNQQQMQSLNDQLATAKYIKNSLNSRIPTQLLPANTGFSSSTIETMIGQYNEAVLKRNNLVANSSERNPLVLDMNESIASMRQAIIHSMDNLVATINTEIRNLRQTDIKTTNQIATNPIQAKYLLSVERQQKVKEALYLYLLQKREENELSQAFTAYNTRVITPPDGPLGPTGPHKMQILLIALIIGLILPAVIIYILEMLNITVRGRKDLEGMKIPFIGEIPMASEKKNNIKLKGFGTSVEKRADNILRKIEDKKEDPLPDVVVKERSRNHVNEAFRVLRTNLEFMLGTDKLNKVILFTSMNPNSGKSFLSINTALSLAINGRHVAVVDLDMRKASISKLIDSPKIGVSSFLSGQVSDWKTMVYKSDLLPKIDVIPVGATPPNPTELLNSKYFSTLITHLCGEYDLVLLDCPPIEMVADTSIISKWTDVTLMVIRAGLLNRDMLPQIDNLYKEKKYKNMGLILNGTVKAYGHYGYSRYSYKYGYGYGYGYGEDEKQ